MDSNATIQKEIEIEVAIVGAGPSGIAASAGLNRLSIANILLEKEDCCASLRKKRTYDRLKLHIGKQFCELAHMPCPFDASTFLPKRCFLSYLKTYMKCFDVEPRYNRHLVSASFDTNVRKWRVEARNTLSGVSEVYVGRLLVVASCENGEEWVPNDMPGLCSFGGELMHSSRYKNGREYHGRNVLVVRCGNSGMEIAQDLSNWGASTSVVARSPVISLDLDVHTHEDSHGLF